MKNPSKSWENWINTNRYKCILKAKRCEKFFILMRTFFPLTWNMIFFFCMEILFHYVTGFSCIWIKTTFKARNCHFHIWKKEIFMVCKRKFVKRLCHTQWRGKIFIRNIFFLFALQEPILLNSLEHCVENTEFYPHLRNISWNHSKSQNDSFVSNFTKILLEW